MSSASVWLEAHVRLAPQRLLAAMLEALPADSALPVPEALAEAASVLYARVVAGEGGREDALYLLAADALFTHAFEAVAEEEPARLASFSKAWSGRGRLAAMIS